MAQILHSLSYKVSQASYGKGPTYSLLKTAISPISLFVLLFIMKFCTDLDNDQYDIFKDISYLSLFTTAHAQNKQFH